MSHTLIPWPSQPLQRASLMVPPPFQHPDVFLVVRRTLNTNVCLLQLRRDRDGSLCVKDPIDVFFAMDEGGGRWRREELNLLERTMAYGVQVHEVREQKVYFSLRALPERSLCATLGQRRSVASVDVAGVHCQLVSVDIHLGEWSLRNPWGIDAIVLQGYQGDGQLRQEVLSP